MGSIFWISGTPPRNEKKNHTNATDNYLSVRNRFRRPGKLCERPETISGVREKYLDVREPFSASGTIIWASGNRFRRPGKLFNRPGTVSGVRENYLAVRKLFPASGKIIWPSGNILNRVRELLIWASGKGAGVPVSVVGFGGTTDVYDYVTEEAFKTNKKQIKIQKTIQNQSKIWRNLKKLQIVWNCINIRGQQTLNNSETQENQTKCEFHNIFFRFWGGAS